MSVAAIAPAVGHLPALHGALSHPSLGEPVNGAATSVTLKAGWMSEPTFSVPIPRRVVKAGAQALLVVLVSLVMSTRFT